MENVKGREVLKEVLSPADPTRFFVSVLQSSCWSSLRRTGTKVLMQQHKLLPVIFAF